MHLNQSRGKGKFDLVTLKCWEKRKSLAEMTDDRLYILNLTYIENALWY